MSRLIYFHEPEAVKIKHESDIFTTVVSTRGRATHS